MKVDFETATLKALAGEASVHPQDVVPMVTAAGVSSNDFANPVARRLFETMLAQLGAAPSKRLDMVALLGACGPMVPREYVVDVISGGELGQTSGRLAGLREASSKRQTLAVLTSGSRVLVEQNTSTAVAIAELRKALDGIQTPGDTIRPLAAEIPGMVDRLEAARKGENVGLVETGIVAFDAYLGGLQPGVLTFIGSLPSVGKSALLASICRNLGKRKVNVGYLSLEDNREWIVRRVAAELASVPVFIVANRPKDLLPSQVGRFGEAMVTAYDELGTVYAEDAEDRPLTLPEVVSRATSMVMRHGCKALILDHMGEVHLDRTDRHDLDVLDVAVGLRGLAKAHNIPVVVAAHLRRRKGLEEKTDKPVITDFAFSAGIERVARVALGLYRHEGDLRVVILKQTQGVADVEFDLEVIASAAMVRNEDRTGALQASARLYA